MEIVSQGVAVDLNTQLYWMQMNLCYPDGFVATSDGWLISDDTTNHSGP